MYDLISNKKETTNNLENILKIIAILNSLPDDKVRDIKNISLGMSL